MAESGVGPLARVAREVAEAAMPRSRRPFSQPPFTQSSLLAILCLRRYEDWTYREAEVRLGKQAELRAALGLAERVPDSAPLYRGLCRTNADDLKRPARTRPCAACPRLPRKGQRSQSRGEGDGLGAGSREPGAGSRER